MFSWALNRSHTVDKTSIVIWEFSSKTWASGKARKVLSSMPSLWGVDYERYPIPDDQSKFSAWCFKLLSASALKLSARNDLGHWFVNVWCGGMRGWYLCLWGNTPVFVWAAHILIKALCTVGSRVWYETKVSVTFVKGCLQTYLTHKRNCTVDWRSRLASDKPVQLINPFPPVKPPQDASRPSYCFVQPAAFYLYLECFWQAQPRFY